MCRKVARENSCHFVYHHWFCGVCRETTVEIPYWRRVTRQILVVLLIGWGHCPLWHAQSEALLISAIEEVTCLSSVWNFCALCSNIISQGNQRWWQHLMLAVFSGYLQSCCFVCFAVVVIYRLVPMAIVLCSCFESSLIYCLCLCRCWYLILDQSCMSGMANNHCQVKESLHLP